MGALALYYSEMKLIQTNRDIGEAMQRWRKFYTPSILADMWKYILLFMPWNQIRPILLVLWIVARGGQFITMPNSYPDEAWYHYDDWTCDYECMAMEYLYWCIVSDMGILNDTQTCNGIDNEWELCSPELFESTDLAMHAIVNDPQYRLPQLAPDGIIVQKIVFKEI